MDGLLTPSSQVRGHPHLSRAADTANWSRGFRLSQEQMTVWVDDWQMHCCRKPFAVGSRVTCTRKRVDTAWLASLLGLDIANSVAAAEQHHGRLPDDAPVTVATVTAISAVHCQFAPKEGGDPREYYYPVADTAVLSPIPSADGWTPDRGDLKFTGYLVQLQTDGA